MLDIRILVAEDSPIESVIIERALVSKGYKVSLVKNGQEALNLFQKEPFDLIITDYFMPGLNGYELLNQIKLSAKPFRALVMTSSQEEELQLRSLNFGALDHLQKPLNLHVFLAKVQQALKMPL